ncbi:MAG TPA: alpha/beta family hydrolase [Candidatus Acidoferrum sp.]|nr:alpha/beta family hydrolase [Candidatus Acidoferrum sp.]
MPTGDKLKFDVQSNGGVSALLVRPPAAQSLLVLGHGAGAGMAHPFLDRLAVELAQTGVATLRYQFPYMEERRRVPDRPELAASTIAAAVRLATEAAPDLPLLAGGKSFGGRMTSQAMAENLLKPVKGLVFFGFPLHPPKRPGTKRAEHLSKIDVPMLFLQGTRDTLADLTLLRPICEKLGARATLHIIPEADHSFHVPKRSGKTDTEVITELAQTTASWANRLID